MGKILLTDGYSILNRGFYALPLLSDKNGTYTNAILGFFNILFRVMEDERPDYLAVALDCHAPTFRHGLFSEYKGTRKAMPEELKMQLPIIREILTSMGITWIEKEGYEADDILGTIARRSEKEGLEVKLLSGDRDLLQIATDHTEILIPKTQGGKTEIHRYFASDVVKEYGVTPTEFIEVKALQGDSSDNIPGVKGVGPKSAEELIRTYHDLESLYEHIDEITKKAKKANLIECKETAFLSRTLATIEVNAPIDFDLKKAKVNSFINEKSTEILLSYSLKSVISKAEALADGDSTEKGVSASRYESKYEFIEDFNDSCKVLERISKEKLTGLCLVPSKGIAVSFEDVNYFLSFYGMFTREYAFDTYFKGLNANIVTSGIKELYPLIGPYKEGMHDVKILAYLLDPVKGDYPVSYLSVKYGARLREEEKNIKDDVLLAIANAEESRLLFDELLKMVKGLNMERLYHDIEMPLSYVLYSMEQDGILLDTQRLKEYSDTLSLSINDLEAKIYELADEKFNINSPKQLGEILFGKLGLPGGKKTKTGYSTSAEVLDSLSDQLIVRSVLEYRTLSKLKSTYADALPQFVASDGRIHTRFNQTVTATGRLSSDKPNLQNIPIRTEEGRELRKVFLPKPGFVFIDADYSQIELRLMAHMSGDEHLINAFLEDRDIHRSTAARVFNIPFEEVTDLERRRAKAVNFGIIYGISSFGLAKDIGTDVKVAKKYIEDYFATYPSVKRYLDETVKGAKDTGMTVTEYGRIRPIPELKDANYMTRQFGERVAMNAPIQGTAADIMKIAMIGIFNRLRSENLESRLIVQVHDEVLIETKIGEENAVIKILHDEMENAARLSVPLKIDVHKGDSWYDAK